MAATSLPHAVIQNAQPVNLKLHTCTGSQTVKTYDLSVNLVAPSWLDMYVARVTGPMVS